MIRKTTNPTANDIASWDFRVMRHEHNGEVWMSIHEVYSNAEGKPRAFDVTGHGIGDDLDQLRRYVAGMLEALDKPILTPEDFSSAISEKADENS